MKRNIVRAILFPLLGVACLAPVSGAAIETYSSVAAWQSAGTQAPGMVTFNGIASANLSSYTSAPVSFYPSPSGSLYGNPMPQSYQNFGEGATMLGPTGGPANFLRISLPSAVFGVGLLVATQGNPGDAVKFVLNGVTASPWNLASTGTLPGGPITFWGLRSDMAITTLDVYTINTGSRLVIDSVRWSIDPLAPPPAETPEASTLIMIGAGLMCLRWLKRRAMPQPQSV